jgi:hypothetical protein
MKIKIKDRVPTYNALVIRDYDYYNFNLNNSFVEGELIKVFNHGMSDSYVYCVYVNDSLCIIPHDYIEILEEIAKYE